MTQEKRVGEYLRATSQRDWWGDIKEWIVILAASLGFVLMVLVVLAVTSGVSLALAYLIIKLAMRL